MLLLVFVKFRKKKTPNLKIIRQLSLLKKQLISVSLVLCFRKTKTKQCLGNALLILLWGLLDLCGSEMSDSNTPARNRDIACFLLC